MESHSKKFHANRFKRQGTAYHLCLRFLSKGKNFSTGNHHHSITVSYCWFIAVKFTFSHVFKMFYLFFVNDLLGCKLQC